MPENAVQIVFDPHVSNALIALAAALLILLGLWAWNIADHQKKR
jgi:hypothetical protein